MNDEFAWRNQLRQLGGGVEPRRDLWPSIVARIAVRPSTLRWRMGLGLTAAAMMALGVGAIAWRSQSQITEPIAATAPSRGATGADTESAPLAWVVPANPALAAASRDLDSASMNLQQALETHPQAVFLVGLLNRTNAQRMRLLQQSSAG
ncbi:MAG: hypothetical protein KGI64_06575 [Xanthomonadaceae bacterium]|nr:hypothetical protein [Xanthomonadaceae bacterium]MDE1885291.1 hypothetical protein [Xanthomonadaceae bacterium]MDE1960273.1 hypothetical protein [Xanthomonadaceae bacterium]MDE2084510.1 hypothetical protein [Xanthomonadaceae bacterium]MDE2257125.1 hypothetical protein [Xanthomonadaceae bacterium]